MKDDMKKKWFVIVIIWAACLLLTCWNVNGIDGISEMREKGAILSMERHFLKENSEAISKALYKKDTLYQSITSINMGLLAVKDDLISLAVSHGLVKERIKIDKNQSNGRNVGITLSCEGSVKGVVELLKELSCNYPYLSISGIEIKIDGLGINGRFEIDLSYRYKTLYSGAEQGEAGFSL